MSITLASDVGQRVALYDANGNPVAFDSSGRLTVIGEMNAYDGSADQRVPTLSNAKGTTANNANAAMVGISTYEAVSGTYVRLAALRDLNDGSNLFDSLKAFAPGAGGLDFNETNWDRHRNNTAVTYLASAARVATPTVSDIVNYNARGIMVFVNVTVSGGGTHGITVTVDAKDPVSGGYKTLLSSAEIAATGLTIYTVCPGITVANNVSAAAILARTIRILPTHTDATSNTYSVGYALML